MAELTGIGVGKHMLLWYTLAALFYIGGRITDKISTVRGLDAIHEFEKKTGTTSTFGEGNDLLPFRPSESDLYGLRKTIVESLVLVSTLPFPLGTAIIGAGSFYAAYHNQQVRRKHLLDVEPD